MNLTSEKLSVKLQKGNTMATGIELIKQLGGEPMLDEGSCMKCQVLHHSPVPFSLKPVSEQLDNLSQSTQKDLGNILGIKC